MTNLEPINLLKVLVIMILVCALSGCTAQTTPQTSNEDLIRNLMLSSRVAMNANQFYLDNGYWPLSDEELEFYCLDPNSKCQWVPWEQIIGQYTELPDGRLRVAVKFKDMDPCSPAPIAFTLNIPDPNFAARIKQQCLSDPNTDIGRVLECALRKELADSNKPAKSNRDKHDDTFWPVVIPLPQHHH